MASHNLTSSSPTQASFFTHTHPHHACLPELSHIPDLGGMGDGDHWEPRVGVHETDSTNEQTAQRPKALKRKKPNEVGTTTEASSFWPLPSQ